MSDLTTFLNFITSWCVLFFNTVTAYWWGAAMIILSIVEIFLIRQNDIGANQK